MFDTCVLGVDPGVARLGLAVVASEGRRQSLVWADTVRTPVGHGRGRAGCRLLAEAMRAAIAEHRPTAVALERVAFNRNQVSALTVARATGAVMVVAAEAGLEVAEYSPSEVKSAVTGMGNADKAQVRAALVRVHGLARRARPSPTPPTPSARRAHAPARGAATARAGRARERGERDDLVPRGRGRREGREPRGAGRRRGRATTSRCRPRWWRRSRRSGAPRACTPAWSCATTR